MFKLNSASERKLEAASARAPTIFGARVDGISTREDRSELNAERLADLAVSRVANVGERVPVGESGALPAGLRRSFESAFHWDLSRVRIHAGSEASAQAAQFGARAFTLGNDIVFGREQYRPHTEDGKRLLAHELAHVAQSRATPALQNVVQRDDKAPVAKTAVRVLAHAHLRILNGEDMPNMLAMLMQVGEDRVAILAEHVDSAEGVNNPRLKVAIAAAQAKFNTPSRDDVTKVDTAASAAVPKDQRDALLAFVGPARPKTSSFWGAYQNIGYNKFSGEESKPQVWKFIGGNVGRDFDAKNGNTCASRVSYALNRSSFSIASGTAGSFHNDPNTKYGNKGDDKHYIVRARDLRKYLAVTLGAPDATLAKEEDVTKLSAGLRSGQGALFAGSGHAGLIMSGYSDPYILSELPVDAWKLAPG